MNALYFHACPVCGGLMRCNPASDRRRLHCTECDTPLILPVRHSFMRGFARAVERGLPRPYPKSRLVA